MRTVLVTTTAILLAAACSGGETGPASPEPSPSASEAASQEKTGDDAAAEEAETEAESPVPETLTSKDGYTLTPVTGGLTFPWDMVFLPSGDMLVSERDGHIRIIRDGELVAEPIAGTPEPLVEGQGGYFAMALDPDFAANRTLYLAYAKGTSEENTTAVIKGTLSEDLSSLNDVQEIFAGTPRATTYHYGGRLAFLPDGTLIVTLGEGFRYMDEAQNPMNYHGTIVRINPDGSIPEDNPYASGEEGAPAVWSYGHRNVQGLVWDETREILWAHEHGPKGGDELNIIEPGKNYGWPEITFGVNYDGTIISEKTKAPGMEQPVVKWVPSIAPSGMTLLGGAEWADWDGDLIVAAMNGPKGQKLVHVDLDEAGEVLGTEDMLADLEIPFRDVASGPDGRLYAATANMEGVIYVISETDPE
ncbi:PQQ-dependent sugar dehydrogenase [Henriciella aquimarina]|uniref:PQQ-dependent sugar dehydrogenase n=1 Tax=Henriciella aquimarina TaxID=545261 RepID=UPI000A044AB0|nr:PQQ-dependent sugar dehydrogenase [Henriciella aquimarina]